MHENCKEEDPLEEEVDTSGWEKVAKGDITDAATGEALDGTVIVIPKGEGDLEKPGDDLQLEPGDTIIVTAPCHAKKSYVGYH